jgi:hypothetical protein
MFEEHVFCVFFRTYFGDFLTDVPLLTDPANFYVPETKLTALNDEHCTTYWNIAYTIPTDRIIIGEFLKVYIYIHTSKHIYIYVCMYKHILRKYNL